MSNHFLVVVSNSIDGTLRTYLLDTVRETLHVGGSHSAGPKVMPMCVTPDHSTLYAAMRGESPRLARYAIKRGAGGLVLRDIFDIDTGFVSLASDCGQRFLLGASYEYHRLVVYDLATLDQGDATPRQTLTDIPNAHAVLLSPDDRFVYVTSLGSDSVVCCVLDPDRDMPLSTIERKPISTGFGPRHMALSPDAAWLYVVSELHGAIAVFRRDAESGLLSLHEVSTRPGALALLECGQVRPPATSAQPDSATPVPSVWAADLRIHPGGRFLYMSERTTSCLFVLRVGADGLLTHAGSVRTEAQPRAFAIDPSGGFLVACGERSGLISLYRMDPDSGMPVLHSRQIGGAGANWVEVIPLFDA